MSTPDPYPRWGSLGLIFLVIVGVVLRLQHVAIGRWVWFDEASLGLFIHDHTFVGIATVEGFHQVLPVGTAWLMKLCAVLGGAYSSWLLRAPALVAGLATVGGTALIARRVLSPWGALATTGMVSLSPTLIYYSWEIKPYSMDAAITVLILAALLLPAGQGILRSWPRAVGVATLAPWFSLPSVYVLPGMLADAFQRDRDHSWRFQDDLYSLFVGSAILALMWGSNVYKNMGPFMRKVWSSSFSPKDADFLTTTGWFAGRMRGAFEHVGGTGEAWVLAAVLALFGLGYRSRTNRTLWAVGLSTAGLWCLGGFFQLYPMAMGTIRMNRLSAFLIPLAAFLVGAGISAVTTDRPKGFAPLLVAALMLGTWSREPAPVEQMAFRREFTRLLTEVKDGDFVGLNPGSFPVWKFHEAAHHFPGGIPAEVVQAGVWQGLKEAPLPPTSPAIRRIWWLGSAHAAINKATWEKTLKDGFVRAPTQPPEKLLSLWIRRGAAQ